MPIIYPSSATAIIRSVQPPTGDISVGQAWEEISPQGEVLERWSFNGSFFISDKKRWFIPTLQASVSSTQRWLLPLNGRVRLETLNWTPSVTGASTPTNYWSMAITEYENVNSGSGTLVYATQLDASNLPASPETVVLSKQLLNKASFRITGSQSKLLQVNLFKTGSPTGIIPGGISITYRDCRL